MSEDIRLWESFYTSFDFFQTEFLCLFFLLYISRNELKKYIQPKQSSLHLFKESFVKKRNQMEVNVFKAYVFVVIDFE